jgi:hypothetical protein
MQGGGGGTRDKPDNRSITSGQSYVSHIQHTMTGDGRYFVAAHARWKYPCYVCEQR